MSSDIKYRLENLRKLRDRLCKKSPAWKSGFEARDWIVKEIKIIKKLANEDQIDKETLIITINNLLELLEPKGEVTDV